MCLWYPRCASEMFQHYVPTVFRQWGLLEGNSGSATRILPVEYTNADYIVLLTVRSQGGMGVGSAQATTKTYFNYRSCGMDSTPHPGQFITIGF